MVTTSNHRHSWQTPGYAPTFSLVIEEWLGPTAGILKCRDCGSYALAHILAWHGAQCELRIFGVRSLATNTFATYQANINRDYCDLARKQNETQALFAATTTSAVLMEFDLKLGIITRVSEDSYHCVPKVWQQLVDEDFLQWSPLLLTNSSDKR